MTSSYTRQGRERAYAIWEEEGRRYGNDLAHWFRGEAEIAPSCWKMATTMNEELWAGAALKIENAAFFFNRMQESLEPPQGAWVAALEASGAIVDTRWQRSFYANLDAFLVMARSVPDTIQWCFGIDRAMTDKNQLKLWFDTLSSWEQTRRCDFSRDFKSHYDAFRSVNMTNARNISLHRSGYAPVEVRITGLFGVSYVGTPVKRVPITESRPANASDDPHDPAVQWAATLRPIPIRPTGDDFHIDGKPLFPLCQAYLESARSLMKDARSIAQRIHGKSPVTPPP